MRAGVYDDVHAAALLQEVAVARRGGCDDVGRQRWQHNFLVGVKPGGAQGRSDRAAQKMMALGGVRARPRDAPHGVVDEAGGGEHAGARPAAGALERKAFGEAGRRIALEAPPKESGEVTRRSAGHAREP